MASQAEIAGHLDLTRQAVGDLVRQGVLPAADAGKLDVDACRVAYIRHLRAAAAGRGDNELARERARLAREQADKAARENAVARGEMVPASDVVAGLQAAFAHCRARILAVPNKAAPLVASMTSPAKIKEKLTELIHDALDELSRTRAVPLSQRRDRAGNGSGDHGGDADMGAAPETDGKRVGRSKPRTKPGSKRRTR